MKKKGDNVIVQGVQDVKDAFLDTKVRVRKFFTPGNILALIISAAIFAAVIVCNATPWAQSVSDNVGTWLLHIIDSVGWLAAGIFFSKALDMILVLVLRGSAKAITIERMIHSFVKYVIAIVVVIGVLVVWLGKEYIAGVLGGVGVLALVIGFGAQKLIGDVIAGVFMVFEGNIAVGDIVTVGDWRGTVKEIGIRSTVLVSARGDEKVFTNSVITEFVNLSRNPSTCAITTCVDYATPVEKTEKAVRDGMQRMKERIPLLLTMPQYVGIEEMAADGYIIKVTAKCAEQDFFQVQRDMTRELMLILQENGVGIAYPQVDVHMRQD